MHDLKEFREAVVMHPMASAGDGDEFRVAEGVEAAVTLPIAGP